MAKMPNERSRWFMQIDASPFALDTIRFAENHSDEPIRVAGKTFFWEGELKASQGQLQAEQSIEQPALGCFKTLPVR